MGLPSPTPGSLRLSACKAHFSASSAISFPNAAGVIDIGSAPKSASRAFQLGIGKCHMASAVAPAANGFQIGNARQPLAPTLPLKSMGFGTSRWQLG